MSKASVSAVLGAQWGDEGKGKLVDILAARFSIIARFNGGANAGHTIVIDGVKFALHLLPCGVLYNNNINVIGNGTVVHIPTLLKEIKNLTFNGYSLENTLKISSRAHILFDFHQILDGLQETRRASNHIGTTKRGIGPCYSSKMNRFGIRFGELAGEWSIFECRYRNFVSLMIEMYALEYDVDEELERFKEYKKILSPFICDTVLLLNNSLNSGKNILAEGANAAMLDIDHGTYPFVTSSSTLSGGICSGLGIPPSRIGTIYGVVKAYCTRVGDGPFPTELSTKDGPGAHLAKTGNEFGTTTGRRRRCGWLDIAVVRYAVMVSGISAINLTKLDVLCGLDEIKLGVAYLLDGERLPPDQMPVTIDQFSNVNVVYESLPGWKEDISSVRSLVDLPVEARMFVERVQILLGVPIVYIGVGPSRDDMIIIKD